MVCFDRLLIIFICEKGIGKVLMLLCEKTIKHIGLELRAVGCFLWGQRKPVCWVRGYFT